MEFYVFFVLTCLWLMYPSEVNGNFQPPEMDKISQQEYTPLIVKLKAKDRYYPGLLVNGLSFVTVRELETHKDVSLCMTLDVEQDKCITTEGVIQSDEDKHVTFVKVLFGPHYSEELKSMIVKEDPSKAESCVCVSYRHQARKIKISSSMVVEGEGCMDLDGAFCDYKYLGAVVEDIPTISESRRASDWKQIRSKRSGNFIVLKINYLMMLATKVVGDDASAKEFKELIHSVRSNKTAGGASYSNNYFNLVLIVPNFVIYTVLF